MSDPRESFSRMMQMSSGYTTTATGIQPNFASPFEGLPLPGGPQGQLLSLTLGPMFQNMMSKAGLTGMGLGHDQNIYDRFQTQQLQLQMQEQLRSAAQLDRASFMSTMRGAAALAGKPMGGQQRLAANRLADLVVSGAPNIAQAYPEILDQLGGSRGSATVMASRLANFGRYRIDPITGQMGTDPKSTQVLSSSIMDDLYSDANISNMRGISAGQLGGIAENLSLRGLVSGSEFGRDGLMRNLGGIDQKVLMARAQAANKGAGIAGITQDKAGNVDLSKISAADLDQLTKDDPVAAKLRDFDASKVKKSIQAYAGAMAAMRDIFGDAGHPNAPIPALMQALEGMTSGAMGQVDPAKLGQMARQTYYLAKTAGISSDSAMIMQQDAAVRGQQLGIESPFAIQATQSSLGFNATMRAKGALATPVFGGMTESALTQANSNMFQQGIASNFGTKLGTLLRMQNMIGKDQLKNTDLGTVLEGVAANKDTVNLADGTQLRLHELSNSQIEAFGEKAGISRGTTQQLLLQAPAAREALMNNPQAASFIRNVAQPADIRDKLSRGTATILTAAASERGIANPAMSRQLNNIATKIITELSKESSEVNRDPAQREAFIAKKLETMLPPEIINEKDPKKKEVMLKALAATVSSNLDTTVKTTMTGFSGYADVSTLIDPATVAASEAMQQDQANQNKARDVTSGIAQSSGLRGLMDAIKDVDIADPDAFKKVLGKTLGGVDTKRIGTELSGPLGDFKKSQKAVNETLHLLSIATPDQRPQLQTELDKRMETLKIDTNKLRIAAIKVNAYSEKGLTGSDVAGAQASSKSERLSFDNMTALQSSSVEATTAQKEAFKKEALIDLTEKTKAIAFDTKLDDASDKKKRAKALLEKIKGGTYTISDEEAQLGIENQRKQIKNATPAEITKVSKQYDITEEQAEELEAVRRTGLRMGIDADAIKAAQLDTTTPGETAVQAQINGIRGLIDAQAATLKPKNDKDANDERVIAAKRYKAFKESKDEPKLKKAKEEADVAIRDVVIRALDKGTMEKVGVSVAKEADKLELTRQQMTNIVQKATEGNLGKFLLGDFDVADEDAKTPLEKSQYKQKLRDDYRKLNEQSTAGLAALNKRLETNKPTDADAALSEKDKKAAIFAAEKKRIGLTATSDDLIRNYKTAFKLDDKIDTDELKKSLNSFSARNALADIIGTQNRVAAISSNTDQLRKDYAAAIRSNDPKTRAADLQKFRATYKLEARDAFERASADLDTMNNLNFDEFKGEKGAANLNRSLKVLDDGSVASAGKNEIRDINVVGKLTGDFKITGDSMLSTSDCDLSARSIA